MILFQTERLGFFGVEEYKMQTKKEVGCMYCLFLKKKQTIFGLFGASSIGHSGNISSVKRLGKYLLGANSQLNIQIGYKPSGLWTQGGIKPQSTAQKSQKKRMEFKDFLKTGEK